MPYIDMVIVGIIGGFGLFGLWFGFVSALGSIAGTVVGLYLASRFYMIPAEWLMSVTGWTGNFSKVIAFILGFLIINRLVGLCFYIVDKALFIFTRLPLIHGTNKLLGLLFGLVEGMLVVGIVLYFIQKFPLWPELMDQIKISKIAPICVNATSFLWPLIPEVIKMIKV